MTMSGDELRRRLESLDYGAGLIREDLRELAPELPDDIYLYLPAAKRYLTADEVLASTGAGAIARSEGELTAPNTEVPEAESLEVDGPPAYGASISPGDHLSEGSGDYPGAADDIGGSSLETRSGRGTQPGQR